MTDPVSKTTEHVDGEDLFDLPVEALSLPGMDAVDSAAAVAAFEMAEPEIAALARAPQPLQGNTQSAPASAKKKPAPRVRLWLALAALGLCNALVIALVFPGKSPTPAHVVEPPPPPVPEVEAHPTADASTPPAAPAPVATSSGRARLLAIESALAEGRRSFARVELGRILLDVDALPANEREETRAQAELLVARILQDTADEVRRSSR